MQDFTLEEKAAMFEHIIDEILTAYEKKPPIPDYKSRAEYVGYSILTMLDNNGFITTEDILGK